MGTNPLTAQTQLALKCLLCAALLSGTVAGCQDDSMPSRSPRQLNSGGDPTVITGLRAQPVVVELVRVDDGDSFVAHAHDGRQINVRISAIDAPEREQYSADEARSALEKLLRQQQIELLIVDTDRYGRSVARVRVNGHDVGQSLIERGLAWHYKRYEKQQPLNLADHYARAEHEARVNKRGLWRAAEPRPPWQYRRRQSRKKMRQ